MKRSTLLLAPLAAALALGCTFAVAAPSTSPFAGTWSGSFIDVTNGGAGTIELSIADNGVLSGSFENTTTGAGSTLHGLVKDDGRLNTSGFDCSVSLVGGHLLVDATLKSSGTNILCDLTD